MLENGKVVIGKLLRYSELRTPGEDAKSYKNHFWTSYVNECSLQESYCQTRIHIQNIWNLLRQDKVQKYFLQKPPFIDKIRRSSTKRSQTKVTVYRTSSSYLFIDLWDWRSVLQIQNFIWINWFCSNAVSKKQHFIYQNLKSILSEWSFYWFVKYHDTLIRSISHHQYIMNLFFTLWGKRFLWNDVSIRSPWSPISLSRIFWWLKYLESL